MSPLVNICDTSFLIVDETNASSIQKDGVNCGSESGRASLRLRRTEKLCECNHDLRNSGVSFLFFVIFKKLKSSQERKERQKGSRNGLRYTKVGTQQKALIPETTRTSEKISTKKLFSRKHFVSSSLKHENQTQSRTITPSPSITLNPRLRRGRSLNTVSFEIGLLQFFNIVW